MLAHAGTGTSSSATPSAAATGSSAATGGTLVNVASVIDGDTIKVRSRRPLIGGGRSLIIETTAALHQH